MVNIAILGFGTVGSGVYEVIRTNAASIARKVGGDIKIKYILDIRDFPDHKEPELFVKNFDTILEDKSVDIVVEVMGGLNPAYDYTKRALLAGKHVVTSNKELVATYGAELLKIAKEKNINYLFEASVGGGIPIIRPLNQCLAANEISEIMGILNGTTNYILTEMSKKGSSFEDALRDAQAKGYAERNPAADIEGHDTCRKIAILTSLVFGYQVDYRLIPTEGITGITKKDVECAHEIGYIIKLIGYSKIIDGKVLARVSPMLIPKSHPLATVEDVFNAILVRGNAIGDVMFYGRGAGKLPTASAVVADIIDISKNMDRSNSCIWNKGEPDMIVNISDSESPWFVRSKSGEDKIKQSFGDCLVTSIGDENVFITQNIREGEFDAKARGLEIINKIRVAK